MWRVGTAVGAELAVLAKLNLEDGLSGGTTLELDDPLKAVSTAPCEIVVTLCTELGADLLDAGRGKRLVTTDPRLGAPLQE